jgi:transposase-like protein
MPKKNETKYDVPQTLMEAVRYFDDPEVCIQFVAKFRWPSGIKCLDCCHDKLRYRKNRQVWCCKSCKREFSVKVGTIFEASPIPLDKWLIALWVVVNCKNGVSSWEVSRTTGVCQKTAWFMCHRLRLALQAGSFDKKLSGEIEADETFIGGKARNMHKGKRKVHGSGTVGKAVVMGLLDRHGEVRVKHIKGRKRGHVEAEVRQHVEPGSEVFTDALKSYDGLSDEYLHQFVDHAEKYVDGKIHTNGLENFWSLLKRAIKGTYVSVQPFHLFRYLDEEAYRFNNRDRHDCQRFMDALLQINGKRLKFKDLIAREGSEVEDLSDRRGKTPLARQFDVMIERIIEPFPFGDQL